jgi:hypothetical protein
MIPTYRIAQRGEDGFFFFPNYSFENLDLARLTIEEMSRGRSIKDFCIMQAVWNVGEIVGWVFVN